MDKVSVQLGEEHYRIVVGVEEGDLAEYGEQATLDTPEAHYLSLIEDPDTEPDQVEVTVRRSGEANHGPVEGVEVVEVEFQGGDDEDEDDDEDGDLDLGEDDDDEDQDDLEEVGGRIG